MERHYEHLNLSPTATEREVREAYRALLKEHHPDHGGSRERFLRIKDAYEAIVGKRAPDNGDVAHRIGPGPSPTYDPVARDVDIGADHRSLTVTGTGLTLSLSALVHDVSLDRLVDDRVPATTERTVAFFRVHNTGDRPLSWNGRAHASFVGDDGFLYEGSSIVTPHADRLPERWCVTDVEIAPGRALDAVVIAQEMPADVSVEEVVYTHPHRATENETERDAAETERYLFELRPLVRERLNRLPFER